MKRPGLTRLFADSVDPQGEFLVYNMTLIGENLNGNQRNLSRHEEGKYDKPVFQRNFNPTTGEVIPVPKVSRHETIYEIPYTPQSGKRHTGKRRI